VRAGEHQIELAAIELVLDGFDLGVKVSRHRFIAELDQLGGIAPALRQRLPTLDEGAQFSELLHHDL
jgi:hypothetical protein